MCNNNKCSNKSTHIDNTYNGWSNKATWLVKLWLDNDEYIHNKINKLPTNKKNFKTNKLLNNYINNLYLNNMTKTGLATDLINYALGNVNWSEIVDSINEA